MGVILERVKALAEPPVDITPFRERLVELNKEIVVLDRKMRPPSSDAFLGIEQSVAIQKECDRHNRYFPRQVDLCIERAGILVKCAFWKLPPAPFEWRDKKGLPKLAIFSVHEAIFEICANGHIRPDLPFHLEVRYSDVIRKLRSGEIPMHSGFKGTVPPYIFVRFERLLTHKTREKVRAFVNGGGFFERVYIVTELVWRKDKMIVGGDETAVGYNRNGDLFLVDSYNSAVVKDFL